MDSTPSRQAKKIYGNDRGSKRLRAAEPPVGVVCAAFFIGMVKKNATYWINK